MKNAVFVLLTLAAWARALGPFTVQGWSGALSASVWDDRYQRGLGGQGSVETHLAENSTACLLLGYEYFKPTADFNTLPVVNQFEATLGVKREFHPSADDAVFPRLGLHLGVSQNWDKKLHLLAGADAEGVIPLQNAWSLFAAFQPSFSWGADNQVFWRFALGALFDVKP